MLPRSPHLVATVRLAAMSDQSVLVPGTLSPQRAVPSSIARPEYVGKEAPTPYTGPEVQDAETVERMRAAGRIAARAMEEAARHIAPGVTTDALDAVAHAYMCDHGAYPSTLGYRRFPKSLCTSVNEVICHGIPDSTVLRDGDIVNLDVTAYIDGVHGDTNATYLCGEVDETSRQLVERTRESLNRAIKAVRPGPAAQRDRPRHRVLRAPVRLRRGAGLHRARHQHLVPLRPDRAALRRPAGDDRDAGPA